MRHHQLTVRDINEYRNYLYTEERSKATIEKYIHDIRYFYDFLGPDQEITKEKMIDFKAHLGGRYKISSANSMLAAVNGILCWLGVSDCRVKSFKNQRQIFCERSRELDQSEYERLVHEARRWGELRLEMIMQTICGTGIRIGELSFITVEAVKTGSARVSNKGKSRMVFLTPKLRGYLLGYCRKRKLSAGPVFVTKNGRPVDRSNIWSDMKRLCKEAGVEAGKVFPHNLRHLFARICYKKKKDIVYLADILGHSNIETTRIYTISSGREHRALLGSLGLVI